MINHDDLFGLNKNEFFIGADKWRIVETSLPFVFEKQDITTGIWAEGDPLKSSNSSSVLDGVRAYRAENYPSIATNDMYLRGVNYSNTTDTWWNSNESNVNYYSENKANYTAIGDYGVILSYHGGLNSGYTDKLIISTNGRTNVSYSLSELIGLPDGYPLSVVWDGIRFVMLHADSDAIGANLSFYWSDDGFTWAQPPNAAGSIFTADYAHGYYILNRGNIDGEVMFTYFSTASLDGFASAYHTAHSLDGFNVATLNDVGITRNVAAASFTPSTIMFKVGNRWINPSTTLSGSTSQESTDNGETWNNFTLYTNGSANYAPVAYGVVGQKAFIVTYGGYTAYTFDGGVTWSNHTNGYGGGTGGVNECKQGAFFSGGTFHFSIRYSGSTARVGCDLLGKDFSIQTETVNGRLHYLYRGYWSFSQYLSVTAYMFKD